MRDKPRTKRGSPEEFLVRGIAMGIRYHVAHLPLICLQRRDLGHPPVELGLRASNPSRISLGN
jgi:hypothetical protein